MRKSDVEIGAVYAAKVSGKIQPVRILRTREHQSPYSNSYGGLSTRTSTQFLAVNENTGREVLIKSAARLRYRM